MSALTRQERRIGHDRRRSFTTPEFPFLDCDETLVRADRRKISDRRITNIYVEDPNIVFSESANEKLFIWSRDKIHEIYSTGKEFWLGRSIQCNECFSSRYVSRKHAKLICAKNQYFLADDSRNGTYIKTNDGEFYLKHDQIALEGSGVISLGIPLEQASSEVVHYFKG